MEEEKETSLKEKIMGIIAHSKIDDPTDCGCYICHHQEEFQGLFEEILDMNKEFIRRLNQRIELKNVNKRHDDGTLTINEVLDIIKEESGFGNGL